MTSRVREPVQRVAESDEQRDYHPEIASRFPNRTALSALEREIAEEVAYSLGKAGKKVERLLAELTQLGQRLDPPSKLGPNERSLLVQQFNQTPFDAERHSSARSLATLREHRTLSHWPAARDRHQKRPRGLLLAQKMS